MKKVTLSILTTAIALVAPLTAFAQEQTSIQTNTNSAAAVGTGNLILQNANQTSVQNRINHNGYRIPATPNNQTAVQGNINEAAAVGNYNVIGQDAVQTNTQGQIDVNQYLPPHLQR